MVGARTEKLDEQVDIEEELALCLRNTLNTVGELTDMLTDIKIREELSEKEYKMLVIEINGKQKDIPSNWNEMTLMSIIVVYTKYYKNTKEMKSKTRMMMVKTYQSSFYSTNQDV